MSETPAPAGFVAAYPLSSSIGDGRGSIDVVQLKEPKVRLFRKFGNPYSISRKISENGDVESIVRFDDAICIKFLSEMSGIDEITFDDISAADYATLRNMLIGIINGLLDPSQATA